MKIKFSLFALVSVALIYSCAPSNPNGMSGSFGSAFSETDWTYHKNTLQKALETAKNGITSSWSNPITKNVGTITPIKTFQNSDGTYCRSYIETSVVNGVRGESEGKACRQPGGKWA